MIALSLAKRRSALRRHQAGAVLFVVSMTLLVLASVGVYALAASANEIKTSGYERQSTQSHYLATYGVLGTLHNVTGPQAQFLVSLMLQHPDTPCLALPNISPTATPPPSPLALACHRMGSSEMAATAQTPWFSGGTFLTYTGTAPYQAGISPGSFGPTPTQGDFFVELTDPTQGPPPKKYSMGQGQTNLCFVYLTATSNALLRNQLSTVQSTNLTTASYASEGTGEGQRARMLVGPMPCPGTQ